MNSASVPPRPGTPLPPVHEDDLPARCESRMERRPALRRTSCSLSLPSLYGSSGHDVDDDSDPQFSSARVFASPSVDYVSTYTHDNDNYYDYDEDDEDFGELIHFRLDEDDGHHVPPLPHIDEDIFSIDEPPMYHGFSYRALAMVKKVWLSRRAQWADRKILPASVPLSPDLSSAYDGIAPPGAFFLPPDYGEELPIPEDFAAPTPAMPAPEQRIAAASPHAQIYPRIGDMCSLRDGRAASVDRAFCNFPLYTIRKVLYLNDMLQHARSSKPDSEKAPPPASMVKADADDSLQTLCMHFTRALVLTTMPKLTADVQLSPGDKGSAPASFARWQILFEKATGRAFSESSLSPSASVCSRASMEMLYDVGHTDTTKLERQGVVAFDRASERLTDMPTGLPTSPPSSSPPKFFVLASDLESDEDGDEDEESIRDEDDEWDEIYLGNGNSPERAQRAYARPVFLSAVADKGADSQGQVTFLDRRGLGHPGIMAH